MENDLVHIENTY